MQIKGAKKRKHLSCKIYQNTKHLFRPLVLLELVCGSLLLSGRAVLGIEVVVFFINMVSFLSNVCFFLLINVMLQVMCHLVNHLMFGFNSSKWARSLISRDKCSENDQVMIPQG